MDRKKSCEQIVLTREEKDWLKRIQKNPGVECPQEEVWQLYLYGLIEPLKAGKGFDFHRFRVAELYGVYREYLRDKRRDQIFESLWLPIVVSVVTTLTVDVLQWWLPRILR